MLNPIRRGSILLLCIAIITALMMIAFAYVRVASLQHESNQSENRNLLAREAAKTGLSHAVEVIVRDYVNGPLSRMEDASHASFISHHRPYESDYPTESALPGGPEAVNLNDLPAENNLLDSLGAGPYGWNSMANQQHIYDGRGRWYEPGFYNQPVNGFNPMATMVSTPVLFGNNTVPVGNFGPAAAALSDRRDGIFYDAHLRRIAYDNADASNDARTARVNARYRLRYAVGVIDLDGEILINGDQAVDHKNLTFTSPLANNADPTHTLTPEERVVRWGHALPQVVYAATKFGQTQYGWSAGVGGGPRMQHVFMGRGCSGNFDIKASNRAPVTFPYMYRNGSIQNFINGTTSGPADNLYFGLVAGGDPIPNDQQLVHALTGAQYSFTNYDEAVSGTAGDNGTAVSLGRFTPFGRGLVKANPVSFSRWSGNVDTPWCVNLMTAPASVIYGMVAGYMPPGALCTWYHQQPPAKPAFLQNGDWLGESYAAALLGCRDLFIKEFGGAFINYTTPSRAVPAITPDFSVADLRGPNERYPGIMAYNGYATPGVPGSGWIHDNLGTYLRATAKPTALNVLGGEVDASGRPEVVRVALRYKENPIFPNPAQGRTELMWWMHDELTGGTTTKTGGPPTSGTPALPPDWSNTVTYPINAFVKILQPGPPLPAVQVYKYYMALVDNSASPPPTWIVDQPGPPVLAKRWEEITWPQTRGWDREVVGAHPDSIWDVIGNAMSATVAVARGQYYQYGYTLRPNEAKIAPPALYFNGSPWSGSRVLSIRDIDALFVENLGSSFTQPNNPTPVSAWKGWMGYIPDLQARLVPFPPANAGDPATPTWNLAKLRTATTTVQVVDTTGSLLPRITVAGPPAQVDLLQPQAPLGVYTFRIAAWNDPAEPRYDGTKPSYTADQRTAVMELIINDFRLSFFGSSPAYANDFRALDLNGDGKAHCSGFRRATGDPTEIDLHIDQYTTSVDGNGIATIPVDDYFANTGCFFVGKSRFWRVVVRGEVWDNVLNTTVNSAQLDTVLCVDPTNAAQEWVPGGTPDAAAGQFGTHMLYQRWFYDPYRGLMPRQQ